MATEAKRPAGERELRDGSAGLDPALELKLVEMAKQARERAYAPYSGFRVGAALLGESGRIYTGGNVENAVYGATICAERTAVARAVSDGETRFAAIAVVADSEELTTPCGTCRQVLAEFAEEIPVILANPQGDRLVVSLSELLPRAFRRRHLSRSQPARGAQP